MMNSIQLTRYRIQFAKKGPMRFTSHLDLQRAWERTLQRAGLPVAYTQGFTPRPRFHLGLALPLGFTSQCELLDLWLTEPIAPQKLLESIQTSAPPGLRPHTAQEIPFVAPKLQAQIEAASYQVHLSPAEAADDLIHKVETLLQQEQIPSERRGKPYDLRPLIEALDLEGDTHAPVLKMRLGATSGGTGRPDEVLAALGLDPLSAVIQRTAIHIALSPDPPKEKVSQADSGPSEAAPGAS